MVMLTPDEQTLIRNRFRHFKREKEATAFEKTLSWYKRWYRELVGRDVSGEYRDAVRDFILKLESETSPHVGHERHLCYLMESNFGIESYKALIRNAKFFCKACGRAATKEENLCEPALL